MEKTLNWKGSTAKFKPHFGGKNKKTNKRSFKKKTKLALKKGKIKDFKILLKSKSIIYFISIV